MVNKKSIKMKVLTYLILAFTVIMSNGCGTMMGAKADESLRSMEIIYEYPGKTKEQLYITANTWFVEVFNSSESVIEFQDKESGKIAGKYTFQFLEGVYYQRIKQTVDIDIKDEKIRIRFLNPMFATTGTALGERYHDDSYKPLITQKGINRARIEWTNTGTSLNTYIKNAKEW